jgi:hypothetical protein
MIIRRSWRAAGGLFASTLAALVWNAFMIGWYWNANIRWNALSLTELFPLLFVGIGLFLAYACLAALLNTTELEVTSDILRVTTGPLPWHRGVRMTTAEIRNVIFREFASKGYSTTYEVNAVTAGDEEKRLVGRLMQYEVVVFYVREIRSFLGLPDTTLSPDA